ncbi:MAG: DUF2283 domain-containing protein [Thaumarchaeota archaeon]|nr:DUF2283 domain-containing protein [Nitrososphaerota archaeon]
MAKNKPEIRYDRDSDILYIKIKEGSIDDTVDVAEDVFVEKDKNGNMVGIEIWRARQLLLNPLAKHISEQVKLVNKAS